MEAHARSGARVCWGPSSRFCAGTELLAQPPRLPDARAHPSPPLRLQELSAAEFWATA